MVRGSSRDEAASSVLAGLAGIASKSCPAMNSAFQHVPYTAVASQRSHGSSEASWVSRSAFRIKAASQVSFAAVPRGALEGASRGGGPAGEMREDV